MKGLVGFCLTEPRSFYLRLSAYENLRFFAALHGLFGTVMERRIREVLEVLELEEVRGDVVLSFSEGMRQRLALARAMLSDPPILLLDEVSRGLDPRLRARLYDIVRDWISRHDRGAVLLASHNMEEVEQLADHVYVMNRGKVVDQGEFSRVRSTIERLFELEA